MNSTIVNPKKRCLIKKLPKKKRHKQSLGFLGNEGFYIYETVRVGELTDALSQKKENIFALAIVDYKMCVKGLITTRELFSLMGRQFGRAILSKKMILEIAQDFKAFDYRQNIFTLEEQNSKNQREDETVYYILQNEENQYKGLFSSRDLLIYLSNITRNDIEMAQNIQRRISREESSIHEIKFDLVASTQAAKGVGGDYYSLIKSHKEKWIISLCDVSGKGISASLLTSTIWGMMSIFDFKKRLSTFLNKVNNYIYNTFESEKFITGIFLEFNSQTGEIILYDMGHSYIYLYRKGKFKKLKTKGNMPIGVAPSDTLQACKFQLCPDDYLFIPTDGLLEQENSKGDLYSPENIKEIITKNLTNPIEEINREIGENFFTFKGEEHLHDDVTYLLLKYYDQIDDTYDQK